MPVALHLGDATPTLKQPDMGTGPQLRRCGEARKKQMRNQSGDWKKWVGVKAAYRNTALTLAGALLLILPAQAQLKLGESSNNLNGTLSAGYNADYGNLIPSDHSLSFGGTGTLSGFYYNPNFLSYTISPYVNQARDNSSFQSISDASGVNVSTSIFAGSKFPGSITYSKSVQQRRQLCDPGSSQLYDAWQQRQFRHRLVRDRGGLAQPLRQFPDGKQPVLDLWFERQREHQFAFV